MAGDLEPGGRLGKYVLERLLGKGGMGEVWAALDPDLDRKVALKVLHHRGSALADAQARFQREGRAMAKLRHPNVVAVHDARFSDGRAVIAMELVDGENLKSWAVREHPTEEILRVLVAAGRGLAAAHTAGIIHRDFKPHNVLVDRHGRVVVTDFGLARTELDPAGDSAREHRPRPELDAADASALAETVSRHEGEAHAETLATPAGPSAGSHPSDRLTMTGDVLGTPAYMAPEQIAGRATDARADIFAFCVTAWELFARERPFDGGSMEELLGAIERGARGPVELIPRRLRAHLVRGLAHDPADRWASLDELVAAIERTWRRPRRIALAAGGLALIAGATGLYLARGGDPVAPPAIIAGCQPGAGATAWSPEIRASLEGLLAGEPHQARTLRFFDRWSRAWGEIQAANCAAPEASTFAARNFCLLGVRDELAAVMERRDRLPKALWASPDLGRLVAMPEACEHDPYGLVPAPPDPRVRDEVMAIRGELAEARVPMMMGSALALFTDVGALVERARRTGYDPVIAEAMLVDALGRGVRARSRDDINRVCDAVAKAEVQADKARYERMVVEALLFRYQCLRRVDRSEETGELLARLRSITSRTQNPVQLAEVELLSAKRASDDGLLDVALADFASARRRYASLEMVRGEEDLAIDEARVLLARHGGDDLDRAAQQLRAAFARTADGPNRDRAIFWLYQAEWQRGHLVDVPPWPPRRRVTRDVQVTVKVVGPEGPAAGVEVGASEMLFADAQRVAMPEMLSDTHGVTGPDGSLSLAIEGEGVALARQGTSIGWALVPARGGTVTIRLAPGASVRGTTTGIHDRPAGDPSDPPGHAARRQPGMVMMIVPSKDEQRLSLVAPVRPDGSWELPVVPPGRYLVVVQAESSVDLQASQTWFEVKPGENTVPPLALAAAPRIVEVVVRTGGARTVIAFADDGRRVPDGWPVLLPRLAAAPWVSAQKLERPGLADTGTERGDLISRLSVDDRPALACALADQVVLRQYATSLPVIADLRPSCVRVEPGAKRVVILPR